MLCYFLVIIPLLWQVAAGVRYRLFASTLHHGESLHNGTNSFRFVIQFLISNLEGHYSAYLIDGARCLHMNDTMKTILTIDDASFDSREAYLLFFEKQ